MLGIPPSMRAIRAATTARRRLYSRLYRRNRFTFYTVFHGSASRRAITQFKMPAMSPTMTEGGIASWKKREGEYFAQGDVLLEIVRPVSSEKPYIMFISIQETDKATIDVEAQEDGIMGKIIVCRPNPTYQFLHPTLL